MTPRVLIRVLDAGPFTMDRSGLVHGASGSITVPSTVVVIEHERHGLILFDTGANHRIADADQAAAQWGPGLREAYGATGFTREHAVDAQLERLGYRCADVTHVVYSHLHIDHAGGMEYFPDAVHVAQHDELRHAWWPDRWSARGYALADYLPGRGFDFLELTADADLFEDGSLRVIRLPGHTPGHQGLIVDLPQRGRVRSSVTPPTSASRSPRMFRRSATGTSSESCCHTSGCAPWIALGSDISRARPGRLRGPADRCRDVGLMPWSIPESR